MHDRPTRPAEAEGRYSHAIAFGVERLGLIPFRAPRLSIAIALPLAALASLEIERVTIDDSLSRLFRSNSPALREYQQVT